NHRAWDNPRSASRLSSSARHPRESCANCMANRCCSGYMPRAFLQNLIISELTTAPACRQDCVGRQCASSPREMFQFCARCSRALEFELRLQRRTNAEEHRIRNAPGKALCHGSNRRQLAFTIEESLLNLFQQVLRQIQRLFETQLLRANGFGQHRVDVLLAASKLASDLCRRPPGARLGDQFMAHVCRRLDYRPAALQRFEKSLAVTFQLARADTADARHVGEGARLAAQHLQ